MFTRPLLRLMVAGSVAVAGLGGSIAVSHAQVAFWHHSRTDRTVQAVHAANGWEIASVRAENRDHVQAQIDRMEARARNDDRLSGRPASPGGRDDEQRARQPGGGDRNSPGEATLRNSEAHPGNVGPGWQARGRDGGR
ncbi:hypothetical protein ACUXAV_001682 [Cupriavidus metallidurans]|uniref:Uncharacterized protein n=1 Tax=Cupriavidus metallidurans (strain ATCC 43123 / DSM 2839 / NBRC 102507 / CH34) TaxID=266264 RepID=Q1LQE4_CUPMC|nr:hypothetical protein [Cupriavidus metallidurans]ABF07632.1 conserved hypothetical protein; putative exported protein [Cupriavidus metallidurans CH34]AVA32877.1 hypothetical protein C3Z06_04115 [Cupriavidus metallidurans]MDE4917062.1 hypothetical protein [Cupriavidus metallidurans]QGS28059.1 hypothetical protein FOB83_03760 [Cupriavidus metallidurans]UBM11780.1 hypothetical protein LAI70_15710 [Cupriavidus metallidurans]